MFIVVISMLVTRTAAVVLQITGMSQDAARFQARSAFTGVGFTTSESESIVNHPVRRQVVKTLMMLGNLGFVTVASTSIITVMGVGSSQSPMLLFGAMLLGLALLWILACSSWVDRMLCRSIAVAIARFTSLGHGNLANLLQLDADHGVSELFVHDGIELCDGPLAGARLREKGIIVLGLKRRSGEYIATPGDEIRVSEGDTLILHGLNSAIADLDRSNDSSRLVSEEE